MRGVTAADGRVVRGRQDLAADGRARSPGVVIEVACCFRRGEEIVEVVV